MLCCAMKEKIRSAQEAGALDVVRDVVRHGDELARLVEVVAHSAVVEGRDAVVPGLARLPNNTRIEEVTLT